MAISPARRRVIGGVRTAPVLQPRSEVRGQMMRFDKMQPQGERHDGDETKQRHTGEQQPEQPVSPRQRVSGRKPQPPRPRRHGRLLALTVPLPARLRVLP